MFSLGPPLLFGAFYFILFFKKEILPSVTGVNGVVLLTNSPACFSKKKRAAGVTADTLSPLLIVHSLYGPTNFYFLTNYNCSYNLFRSKQK